METNVVLETRSRAQMNRAAGLTVQIITLAQQLDWDGQDPELGRTGETAISGAVESLIATAQQLLLDIGDVLLQAGDVLTLGQRPLSAAEIEQRVKAAERAERDRQSIERHTRVRIQDAVAGALRSYSGDEFDPVMRSALRDELEEQLRRLENVEDHEDQGSASGLAIVE